MSYVLGLDLSLTSTGRAGVYQDGRPPETGTVTTRPAGDDYAARHARLLAAADQILPTVHPDLVVVEGPSYGSSAQKSASIHDRAGLWWTVVGQLLDAGTPVAVVAPRTRAKWATGTGNADKTKVAVGVARLWPDHDARTDDEWDALALATMGAQWLGWDMPTRAHHALTLAAVTWPTLAEPDSPNTTPREPAPHTDPSPHPDPMTTNPAPVTR